MREIRIQLLRCGSIALSHEALFGGREGLASVLRQAAAPRSERIELPCFCYLIEHPKGLVLVDTGVGRAFSPSGVFDAKASAALIGKPLTAYLHPSVPPGESISEQLSSRGLMSSDLDLVLLTHLDADHVGGLHELRGAKRFLLPEDEYFWSCRTVFKARQPRALWYDPAMERRYYRGSPMGPNRWAIDLFGDESIRMVNVPGHTDGQAAILIQNGGAFVLLAADAAFSPRNWEEKITPGFGFSREWQLKSLKWIAEMAADPACKGVLCSHDPAVAPGIISL